MYLLVFITLVIGLTSIYTQILVVQAARIAAHQTSIAQTILTWHTAAVSMAASIIATNASGGTGAGSSATSYDVVPDTAGCSLSNPAVANLTRCPGPKDSAGNPINPSGAPTLPRSGTLTDGQNTPVWYKIYNKVTGAIEPLHIPPTYNVNIYQFSSILYKDVTNKANYVVTYVAPATISVSNPNGFLTLANGTQIGVTAADLMQQLQHAGVPPYTYGYISGGVLRTSMSDSSVLPVAATAYNFQYQLPATVVIPDGAVAVISWPTGY